jgi:hypothetical protein
MKECPACGLINPDGALECDCGFRFREPTPDDASTAVSDTPSRAVLPAFRDTWVMEWGLLVVDADGIAYIPVGRTWVMVLLLPPMLLLMLPLVVMVVFAGGDSGPVLGFLITAVWVVASLVVGLLLTMPGERRASSCARAAIADGTGSLEAVRGAWRLRWEQMADISVGRWRQAVRMEAVMLDGSVVHVSLGHLRGKFLGGYGDRDAIVAKAQEAIRLYAPSCPAPACQHGAAALPADQHGPASGLSAPPKTAPLPGDPRARQEAPPPEQASGASTDQAEPVVAQAPSRLQGAETAGKSDSVSAWTLVLRVLVAASPLGFFATGAAVGLPVGLHVAVVILALLPFAAFPLLAWRLGRSSFLWFFLGAMTLGLAGVVLALMQPKTAEAPARPQLVDTDRKPESLAVLIRRAQS